MPYKSSADLPQAVRTALPAEAQAIFRSAYNSIAAGDPNMSEQQCFKMAWGAVGKAGWHAPSSGEGQWTKDSIDENDLALAALAELDADPPALPYGDVPYADPGLQPDKKKRYPIDTEAHIRAAWNYINQEKNAGQYGSGQVARIKSRIVAAWKKKIDPAGPPSAQDSFDESPGPLWAFERLALDAGAAVRKTSDGYLVAYPRVARTGIQLYAGAELGRNDLEKVRVYRPEGEVFHRDSLHSYAYRPVTNDHPPEMVTSANWRQYSVGDLGEEVVRDGQFVRVPMRLMDQAAIDDFEAGKAELSLGYTMDLKWESGTTPQGDAYDAVQSHIRANHLALTDAARGGPMLRIGDTYPAGGSQMTAKQITVDGFRVSLDERDAEIVQRTLTQHDQTVAELKAKIAEMEKEAAAEKKREGDSAEALKTKDATIATLQKQLKDAEITPDKLQAMVKDRSAVIDKAKAMLGDKLVIDGRTDDDIRRQVVDAQMGAASKDWTPDQVRASFDSFAARISTNGNQLDHVLRDGLQAPGNAREASDRAYEAMVKRSQDAWKPKQTATV